MVCSASCAIAILRYNSVCVISFSKIGRRALIPRLACSDARSRASMALLGQGRDLEVILATFQGFDVSGSGPRVADD